MIIGGLASKHWPEDAFLTGRFYAPQAIAFVKEGGLRERMTRARLEERGKSGSCGHTFSPDFKDSKDCGDNKDNQDRRDSRD